MTISVGETLPDANLLYIGEEGPAAKSVAELTAGRKVAIFAVPGAFTPTCQNTHVPGFVANADALRAKGVDEIACISVNDPFVMKAFGEATGAHGAGITMLADADGSFSKALGLDFSAPPVGLIGRSQRYAALIEDGVVKALNIEGTPGTAVESSAEALLDAL